MLATEGNARLLPPLLEASLEEQTVAVEGVKNQRQGETEKEGSVEDREVVV